jgi:uncharacterized protein YciI
MTRFVRFDQKIGKEKLSETEFQAHLEFMEKSAEERSMMAGGFVGDPGGMVVFEAQSLKQARGWASRDPLFESGKYKFQLYEWSLVIHTISGGEESHGDGKI